MKQQYEERIENLETEVKVSKKENQKLRDDNDRLKKQINKDVIIHLSLYQVI